MAKSHPHALPKQAPQVRPQPPHRGGFRLPQPPIIPKLEPCGARLVRLRDVPKQTRLVAARQAEKIAKDGREASRLMALALEPGDAGGRIAA